MAQNGQFTAQPACDEMQTVVRSDMAPARRVAHQDRFDALPVLQLVDRLGGHAAIGAQHVAVGDRAEAERLRQLRAQRRRQVGQVVEGRCLGPMRTGQHLRHPVRGLAAGGEPRGERCGVDLADRRRGAGERKPKISHAVRR